LAGLFLGERRIAINCFGHAIEGGPVADALDHDVEALKDWLRGAWRYLADPSITRLERRQLREYMKQADADLRAGLQQLAARETRNDKGKIFNRAAKPRPDDKKESAVRDCLPPD
jgi:hypothetical protein